MLNLDEFEVLDVVPIPMGGDRLVRLKTLEEAIEDFKLSSDEVHGYFIQVKPKRQQQAAGATTAPATPATTAAAAPALAPANTAAASSASVPVTAPATGISSGDGIYLSDGKLNLTQLSHSADLLFVSGDYALARNIYKAMIRAGENTAGALVGLARCYEVEGKLEEARINYEESIAYHPHTSAYKALTSLLIRLKKDQEAAETLERALLLKDATAETRFEFHKTAGNCWTRVGNMKEAERSYRRALEIRPDSNDILTNLGATHLASNKITEALRFFQDALNADPKNHQALCGIATCALEIGDKTQAHDLFARALRIDLRNPTAIFHLVKCAYATKSYSTAAEILGQYVQIAPVNTSLLYSLAGLQFHLGRLTESFATCEEIMKIAPDHTGARELANRIAGSSTQ